VILRSLQVSGFRNLQPQTLEWAEGINLLVGGNGQGKTNVLEAIFFLATLRSFRKTNTRDVIQHGLASSEIQGSLTRQDTPIDLRVVLTKEGRRIWLGRRAVSQVREYLGCMSAVAFTPDDLSMIKGGPEFRRRFLDRTVFLFFPEHLRTVYEFNRALRSRNRLLKDSSRPDPAVLEGFTATLAIHGEKISRLRGEVVDRISWRTQRRLADLSGGTLLLEVRFKPGWQMAPGETRSLEQQLSAARDQDLRRKTTTVGPQFDDLDILLGGRPARKFASQGQQRASALGLLLAVVEEAIEVGHDKPLVLLDDFSSELDRDLQGKFFDSVIGMGCQTLVTTTDPSSSSLLAAGSTTRFQVDQGKIVRVLDCALQPR
jgi:DNA replication and repair protein RecF